MLSTKPNKDEYKTDRTKKLNKVHLLKGTYNYVSSIWTQDKFCLGSTFIKHVSKRDYGTYMFDESTWFCYKGHWSIALTRLSCKRKITKNQGKTMVFEGVLDSDYKGEIRVLLINYSARDVVIFNEVDTIAKIVLNEIHQASSLKENEG